MNKGDIRYGVPLALVCMTTAETLFSHNDMDLIGKIYKFSAINSHMSVLWVNLQPLEMLD